MLKQAAPWLILSVLLSVRPAEARPLRLEWDPSADAEVVGYLVYVGTESGRYSESYDVGPATLFDYQGQDGQTFYFAVASYRPGHTLSPLSSEVVAYGETSPNTSSLQNPATPDPLDRSQASVPCSTATCATATPVAGDLGSVSSLAKLPDGRLLIVEDNRRVRVAVAGRVLNGAVLEAPRARLTSVVADPLFVRTRFLYVGEVETRADGQRELTIVRYRELNNQLGEAAVIVPGLPLNGSDDAPIALDDNGHLYVALPGTNDGQRMGAILRFNTDGSVPRENRSGSPIVAYGFASPVALEWDSAAQRLWMSGSDSHMTSPIAYVLPSVTDGEWPQWPRSALVRPASQPPHTFVSVARLTSQRELNLLFPENVDGQISGDPAASFERLDLGALGSPVAVTSGADGRTYIAVQPLGDAHVSVVSVEN